MDGITISGFTVKTRKLPISKAGPIEDMTAALGIAPPEMIFGDNLVSIEHPSGFAISFTAFEALQRVDKAGTTLQVAHSEEWQKSREHHHEEIKEVVKPFDWSYTTDYRGSVKGPFAFESTTDQVPLELLRQPDPIRFFDDVMLYEDELADNGITMLSCKIRVMPQRLLLLCRFFMRLDGVTCRIRDTRVFVEFGTGQVLREYTSRESDYDSMRQQLRQRGNDIPAMLRDANLLSTLLPTVSQRTESLIIALQ